MWSGEEPSTSLTTLFCNIIEQLDMTFQSAPLFWINDVERIVAFGPFALILGGARRTWRNIFKSPRWWLLVWNIIRNSVSLFVCESHVRVNLSPKKHPSGSQFVVRSTFVPWTRIELAWVPPFDHNWVKSRTWRLLSERLQPGCMLETNRNQTRILVGGFKLESP